MRIRLRLLPGLLLATAPLVLTCGGGGGGGGGSNNPPPPPPNTIYVGGTGYGGGGYALDSLVFTPLTLMVTRGTTVTFVWKGDGHGLQSGSNCAGDAWFRSGGIKNTGYSMTYTFNTAGPFPFYCTSHCGQNMKGTITVQ